MQDKDSMINSIPEEDGEYKEKKLTHFSKKKTNNVGLASSSNIQMNDLDYASI